MILLFLKAPVAIDVTFVLSIYSGITIAQSLPLYPVIWIVTVELVVYSKSEAGVS